ncbi:MAG: hypothetical protein JJT96_00510 [Opitutales bacterium]|nr:hypothetical protein [Opitutales bacterium]
MHLVATLVEGHFLKGAAALYNSLVAHGFDGCFVVGHRGKGDLPADLVQRMSGLPGDSPAIEFVSLDTPLHFTNYKPHFLESLFANRPGVTAITYLDPDIVCLAPWHWLRSWPEHSVTVAGDVNWRMGPEHPIRHAWMKRVASLNLPVKRKPETYYNGGLLAIPRRDAAFLGLWRTIIDDFAGKETALDGQGEITLWRKEGRWNLFHTPDQDALNIAVMLWSGEICALGPDAMGFAPGGAPLIPHAVGPDKPWLRANLKEALRGRPPRVVDKAFWEFCGGPVQVCSPIQLRRQRRILALCALLGRFYRRGGL